MSVSVIIPAYNEEKTIGTVIEALKKVDGLDEIVVVSDGSSDGTVPAARKLGVKLVELPENRGKGAAVKAGLEECSGEIILLLDADLLGLMDMHVKKLLKPVLDDAYDMAVGIFHSGRLSTDLAQKITPSLSGQRALKRSILEDIQDIEASGYGIEVALTEYCRKVNVRVCEVELEDLTHVTKEEKLGFFKGFARRMQMYWQIYKEMRLAKR